MVDNKRSSGYVSLWIMERMVVACSNRLAWDSYVMTVFPAPAYLQMSECIKMLRLGVLQETDVRIPGQQRVEFWPALSQFWNLSVFNSH